MIARTRPYIFRALMLSVTNDFLLRIKVVGTRGVPSNNWRTQCLHVFMEAAFLSPFLD